MITEKQLQKKAIRYASGISKAFPKKVVREWKEVFKLIEAAYFNGFQSGVVWQKRENEIDSERPFRIEVESVDLGNGRVSNMEKAVTEEGHFIGSPKDAMVLWKKFGITQFELRTKKSKVCSVGYSPTWAQWFGWSHRAIKSFKTKREAAKFAESVS